MDVEHFQPKGVDAVITIKSEEEFEEMHEGFLHTENGFVSEIYDSQDTKDKFFIRKDRVTIVYTCEY
jgi:hypothetical protein